MVACIHTSHISVTSLRSNLNNAIRTVLKMRTKMKRQERIAKQKSANKANPAESAAGLQLLHWHVTFC